MHAVHVLAKTPYVHIFFLYLTTPNLFCLCQVIDLSSTEDKDSDLEIIDVLPDDVKIELDKSLMSLPDFGEEFIRVPPPPPPRRSTRQKALFNKGNLRGASQELRDFVAEAQGGVIPNKPRQYPCSVCRLLFDSRVQVNHHVNVTHGTRFKCHFCPSTYISKVGRDDHIKAVHDSNRLFNCDECGKRFAYMSKLQEHMATHAPVALPCELCDKLFKDEHNLKKHVTEIHFPSRTQKYFCPTGCGFNHSVARYVKDHLRKKHKLTIRTSMLKPQPVDD